MRARRLRAAALDRIFEQALLVGSATLLSGCCGFLSRMSSPSSGIRVVQVSLAKDARLQEAARSRYTEGLDLEICDSYCGSDIKGCSLGKLSVPRPEALPEVRCEYARGETELRSSPEGAAGSGGARAPDCSYVCAYPGRQVKSCTPVVPAAEDDVLLCRYYHPAQCVTHIPSGRAPDSLNRDDLPELTCAARYFAAAAYLEAASALAFDDLALQLKHHGAPAVLVRRCRRAARDERFHRRALGKLGGADCESLAEPELPARAAPSLCELALENVAEGCVVETYSALVMAYQARHAASPELRGLLTRVARDERRHALLSWDILAWSRRRLSSAGRQQMGQRLRAARARLGATLPRFSNELRAELGLPDVPVARAMLRSLDAELWRDGAAVASAGREAAAFA